MRDQTEYNKQYYKDNKEKENERLRLYRQDNPEKIAKAVKLWRLNNKKHIKECYRQWAKDHREQRNEDNRQYFKTKKGRVAHKKHNFKRRELGFNCLNKDFEGSEAHHINKDDVIYILKELHRSIFHCLKTGRGMEKINRLAMESIGE